MNIEQVPIENVITFRSLINLSKGEYEITLTTKDGDITVKTEKQTEWRRYMEYEIQFLRSRMALLA